MIFLFCVIVLNSILVVGVDSHLWLTFLLFVN